MRPLLVYVDTSVFGGIFDLEFEEDTRRFFQLAEEGLFRLAVSEQVAKEIKPAPALVKGFFNAMLPTLEYLHDSPEVQGLSESYVQQKVVGVNSLADAVHVAYATVRKCDGLVSWNYKHMIHPDKCALFNVVNLVQGYPQLFIASPREVISNA